MAHEKAPVGAGALAHDLNAEIKNIDRRPCGQQVDPRLAFLLRAAAKLILVESCHLDLDTAFADLVPAFKAIAVPPCTCERQTLDAWERYDQKIRRERLRNWRVRPAVTPGRRP
jgi:hypothetical protein